MTTTRIADLPNPSGNEFSLKDSQFTRSGESPNNTYTPINVHPNPYGYEDAVSAVSTNPPILPTPQNTSENINKQMPQITPFLEQSLNLTSEQKNMIQNTPHQRIPSRDIHISKTEYTQDESANPNYIPPPSTTYRREQDYVKEHILDNERKRQEKMKKKNQSEFFDKIWEVLQIPTMISLLFFFFQYPILDKLIFRRLNYEGFSLYGNDGNMNLYGNITKSILFGVCIYTIMKTTDYISSI
jgi:hypothetical protein